MAGNTGHRVRKSFWPKHDAMAAYTVLKKSNSTIIIEEILASI